MSAPKQIPFARPDTGSTEAEAVASVLASGWVGKGAVVEDFEASLSTRLMGEVVAVSSATAGLFLALKSFGVGPGDEVITTALTFSATAASILHAGAKPVFADVGPDLSIDPSSIESKITERTKAIIAVDYAGNPCDYGQVVGLAEAARPRFLAHGSSQDKLGRALVVADAAHSFGATLDGKPVSQHADLAVFSFHATKNITTGDGGALAINPSQPLDGLAAEARTMSCHGMSRDAHARRQRNESDYEIVGLGYKMNMTDVEAAIGLAQLDRFDGFLRARKKLVRQYQSLLGGVERVRTNVAARDGVESACHLMSICVNGWSAAIRDQALSLMSNENIECAVHYVPLPRFGYYKGLGYTMDGLDATEKLSDEQLSLPLFTTMAEEDVVRVVSSLKKILARSLF